MPVVKSSSSDFTDSSLLLDGLVCFLVRSFSKAATGLVGAYSHGVFAAFMCMTALLGATVCVADRRKEAGNPLF